MVGEVVGDTLGEVVGVVLGTVDGEVVGDLFGEIVGEIDGEVVGAMVGAVVGEAVGEVVVGDRATVGGVVLGDCVGECVPTMQLTTTFLATKMDGPMVPHPVCRNAFLPINVTVAGMSIEVIDESWNAPSPMVVSCDPASNVTVARLEHLANA
jgi:hypothetical protein